MSLSKYYLSDSPNKEALMNKDVIWLSVCDNLSRMGKCLIYCDSVKMISQIRELDEQGVIHLGCRGASVSALCNIDVVRFGENYIIFSQGWDEDKYKYFLCFSPGCDKQYAVSHYVNIKKELFPERVFLEQMATLEDSELGIDFETKGFPDEVGFSPLGLAIGDRKNAYYYDFAEYEETVLSKPVFYSVLERFIENNSHRLYAFNVSFEIRCLFYMYRKFFKLQDTKVWCIIDGVKSNLKFCAQYYLQSKPWDDKIEEEKRYLRNSFKMSVVDFVKQYMLSTDNTVECVRKLKTINSSNHDFLVRYKKHRGNEWACCNQENLGHYCCYDAVMDVYIYDEIRSKSHIDHKYNDECYKVYLYNQYLLTMMELSGIWINKNLLEKQNYIYNKIIFNTGLYINKTLIKCKIEQLKKRCHVNFNFEVSGPVAYMLDELGSYMFTYDPVSMAKEFIFMTKNKPALFERLVDKHYDQLMFIIATWNKDEEFSNIVKQRKTLAMIGNLLIDEWNLGPLYRAYRNQTGCLTTSGDLQKVFEIRALEHKLERVKKALVGRTIYSEVDESLQWINEYELNSPQVTDKLSEIVEEYYRDDYALYAMFAEVTRRGAGYTKDGFLNFSEQMKAKFSDLSTVKQFHDFYYREQPVYYDTGKIKVPTGKTETVPLHWSMKAGDDEPPFSLPLGLRCNPWGDNPDEYKLDYEFDVRALELFYFIGIYKLNRVVAKISQTSLRSVLNDSFSVKMLDDTKCQKYNKVIENTPVKYFTKTLANDSITNRWVSNAHSLFSGTEDTRVVLQSKMGTHFLLPYKGGENFCGDIFEINGYNFRETDMVKIKTGEFKQVSKLTESDEFDNLWLTAVIEDDKRRTGNVDWNFMEKT